MAKISAEERRWRAESDADTMARYQEIVSDKTRMNAALKAAQKQASDYQRRADRLTSISKKKK